jgi:hypothetical protein
VERGGARVFNTRKKPSEIKFSFLFIEQIVNFLPTLAALFVMGPAVFPHPLASAGSLELTQSQLLAL